MGEPERRHGLGERALGREPPRPGEEQPRVGGHEAVRQHALQRPQRPGDDLRAAALQQLLDGRPVFGAHVGAERRGHLARVEQQLRGPAVPVARRGRPEVFGQLQLEVVEQHLVVAELVAVVRCGREQPALLQLLEHGLAADGVEQRVAQGAGQHPERARAAQELAQLGRQIAEHLADEVGAHQPRPAGQVGQRPPPLRRWAALGQQVEHREPGRPPGGALRQRRGVLGRQRLVVDLAEQPLDLPRAEPQVVGVDHVHRAVDPQRRHVQPDDPARAEHHAQRRRRERDHPRQPVLRRRARDGVEVVEHEQHVAPGGVEYGRHVLERPALRTGQAHPAQGAPDPPGQLLGVAVRRVDPVPDHRAGEPGRDLAEQRGLAVACGSEHQHDAVRGEVEQAAAGEPGGRRWRELRREVQPAFTHPAPRTSKSGGTAWRRACSSLPHAPREATRNGAGA